MKVLLANAQADEVHQTSLSLRRHDPAYRIETVFSAEELIGWAVKDEWRAIIIDAELLEPSPTDVLLELKRRAVHAVLIYVTTHDSLTGEQAVPSGADLVLSKRSPVFLDELPLLLDTLLHTRTLTTQLGAAQARLQQRTAHLTQILTERARLEGELRQTQAQLQDRDQQLGDLRASGPSPEEVQRLRDALAEAQERVNRLEQQLPEIEAQRQRALDELAHLRQDAGQKEEQLLLLEERLHRQEAEKHARLQENQTLQQAARDAEARLRHLEQKCLEGAEQHQPLLTQLDQVKRELATAVGQRDHLQKVYEEVRDRLQQGNSQLRDAVAQRAGESETEPPADYVERLRELGANLARVEAEKQELAQQLNHIQQKQADLLTRLEDREEQWAQERTEKWKWIKKSLDKISEERLRYQDRVKSLEEQFAQQQPEEQACAPV